LETRTPDYNPLPFINDSLCIIEDADSALSSFTAELAELLAGKDTVINIVHLGDSHIQAGFLSGQTMRLLQNSFGNAGRGWIAPFRLMRQNEPTDYFIQSNINTWTAGRCVQPTPRCPWGIGGVGIMTNARSVNFKLIIAPRNGAGYSFNRAIMFRDPKAAPMEPSATSIPLVSELTHGIEPYESIVTDTFLTGSPIDTLQLRSVPNKGNGGANNLYYGFLLTNGKPGVLYHAIGVNGAKYTDFTNRSYFRQLSLLKPSLLIVSLGTNESFGRNFSEEEFEAQVAAFVALAREELPGTTLLLTTPVESYRRAYKDKKRYYVPNENIGRVSGTICSFAKRNGIACLDMFAASGGEKSCVKWFESGLFGGDRIHFSRAGYTEQGNMLYRAMMRTVSPRLCEQSEAISSLPRLCERSEAISSLPRHCERSEAISSLPRHCERSEAISSLPRHCERSEAISSLPRHCERSEAISSLPRHCERSEAISSRPRLCERSEAISLTGGLKTRTPTFTKEIASLQERLSLTATTTRDCFVPRNDGCPTRDCFVPRNDVTIFNSNKE
jgi:lysophospholipase L1-like esterase